ncbi:hypothetical protein AMTRI_Chr13g83880 [Amborella trichopoda]|uniref:Major facilitator superfamily (MFS) profile domain-containing protein n=1 Tax=Amborella trichopoda TaxID=13333 RepID=W1NTE9_AMBTC|nr:putative glycerol-3-phosphate transporter 1 [Amborella trichopoda]ERN00707.1 hypothetical protein AMTR_s00106p00084110 [Amborella trichopoda]|eukprot:XP_011621353.1 putative glycerol-3-phosphate transporter 1 [Amborella trichopoda]
MGSLNHESGKPPAIKLVESIKKSTLSKRTYQATVLIVTFLAYASYHASRKTTSIVKSALDPGSSELSHSHVSWPGNKFLKMTNNALGSRLTSGWAPFNGDNGTALLGELDLAFLSFYAMGMYFAGHLGDRLDLRIFLSLGMIGTGFFTALFGLGYWLNIHSFIFFLVVQMLAGLFQSTGWPSVMAVMGKWFGKKKRGLIMGIWNAHTSVGNISGSLMASAMLNYGWGWSFVVPGLVISFVGLLVFLFLSVSPEVVDVGVEDRKSDGSVDVLKKGQVSEPLLGEVAGQERSNGRAVGFIEAWKIPGVAPFALCLFFSKLVAYTFLYWLPFYISRTEIGGQYLSDETAGNLSTIFDVGGVVGGILAGHISDRLNARAITAATFTYCAIPALFFYRVYGDISLYLNAILMFIAGAFVNGPYALITTAVSADLGTVGGGPRALATVTAIIDGTGSVGAALGPLLTGYISAKSWNGVFMMLMVAALVAGLLLTRLVMAEVSAKIERAQQSQPVETAWV